jgi:hypothetical protein
MGFAQRYPKFSGGIPKVSYRLLPDGAASAASDVYLTSGRIDPMFQPSAVSATLSSSSAKSIYRMAYNGVDYWFSWDSDVDVARSPLAGDSTYKIGFTSDQFEPRQTNWALGCTSGGGSAPYPNAFYVLGVYPPATALTIGAVTGGSGATESRSYLYTFVTQWGEESAPAAVAGPSAAGYANGSWALSGMDIPPTNSGTVSAATYSTGVVTLTVNTTFGLRANEQITFASVAGMTDLNSTFRILSVVDSTHLKVTLTTAQTYTSGGAWTRVAPHNTASMTKRIYRTATAADGTTNYYFVAEISAATTTYADAILGSALGTAIPSLTWSMPPANMQGLMALPNGVWCGFYNNQVCFSDPLHPYAWPVGYQLTSDFQIVGMGSFGQTVVVGTTGTPYVTNGTVPGQMSMSKMSYSWPCLAKRGMICFGGNVYYPTNEGLACVGINGEEIVSAGLYSQVDWEALKPSTFVAANYNNSYYTYHNAGTPEVLVMNQTTGVVTINSQPVELWTDPASGRIYAQYSGSVWDLNDTSKTRKSASWTSKEYVVPKPICLGAVKVEAQYSLSPAQAAANAAWNAAITAYNASLVANLYNVGGALNNSPLNYTKVVSSVAVGLPVNGTLFRNDYKLTQSVGFELFANDTVIFSGVAISSDVIRLPSGAKYDNFYFQISSNVPVEAIVMAETPRGLMQV